MAFLEVTGITGTGRSAFDNLGKDWYGAMWQDHANDKVVILGLIGKVRGKMGGRRVLNAVVSGYPQSAGFASQEGFTLQNPTSLSAFQPELITRSVYIRLRWTGEVEDAARAGDKAAFAGPRAIELRLARKQYGLNKARMAYLGPYQILGRVATGGWADATNTATLTGRNERTSLAADFWNFGRHYLRANMAIQWATTVTGDPVTAMATEQITVTSPGGTVAAPTFITSTEPTTDPVAGDRLFPWGSRRNSVAGATDANRDSHFSGYNGLSNLMLDTNIYSHVYGQTRTSFPTLSGARDTASGVLRPFEDMQIALMVDKIADDGIGDEPDCVVVHRSGRREVFKVGQDRQRLPAVQTGRGFAELTFNAGDRPIPYKVDRDAPPAMAWGLRRSTFGYLSNRVLASIDKGMDRFVSNEDAHEINWGERGNFFCTAPVSNGTVEDLISDVDVAT